MLVTLGMSQLEKMVITFDFIARKISAHYHSLASKLKSILIHWTNTYGYKFKFLIFTVIASCSVATTLERRHV